MAAVAPMECDDDRRCSASSTASFRDFSGFSVSSARTSVAGSVTPDLQAKAEEKIVWAQRLVRQLEKAIKNYDEEDQKFLRKLIAPNDAIFTTMCNLLTARKYAPFILLRCVVLRAIQVIIKVAVGLYTQGDISDADIGMKCFNELAGQPLATKAFDEVHKLADQPEQAVLSCDAMLVLSELGPQAFGVGLVARLLGLYVTVPDRASELTEVALRLHAWGDPTRAKLLEVTLSDNGGTALVEVLLQMVNRSDEKRSLRAVKVLTGCLLMPDGHHLLYTNDAHVLVEILLRELPNRVECETEFICFAECLRVLELKCRAARDHRRADVVQVLQDLRDDERNASVTRHKCTEVLEAMHNA